MYVVLGKPGSGQGISLFFGNILQIEFAEMANGAIFGLISELNYCQELTPILVFENECLASVSFIGIFVINIVVFQYSTMCHN